MARMIDGVLGGVGVVSALLAGCAPKYTQPPIFPPLSYHSSLPRVSVYPQIAMQGHEVIVVARPFKIPNAEVCVRVVDGDGFAWHETCGDTASRRVEFRPVKPGRHIAYIYYAVNGEAAHVRSDRAEFCVLGEFAECP